MNLHYVSDAIQCKAFCTTSQEGARRWYNRLPPWLITCFINFKKMFLNQFMTNRRPQKTTIEIIQLTQNKGESPRDHMARFNNKVVEVPDLTCSSMLVALLNNTRNEEFQKLVLDQPTIIQEIKNQAKKYIQLEEMLKNTKRGAEEKLPSRSKEQNEREKNSSDWKKLVERNKNQSNEHFTHLNQYYSNVLAAMQEERENYRKASKMKGLLKKKNPKLYCLFHKDIGHDIEDCIDLKHKIEFLISIGRFRKVYKERL